jgi:branched-chain amino acid transport system ATP-binding protein
VIPQLAPNTDTRPWIKRFGTGLAHPGDWLRGVVGSGAIYPILILFGLNMVDEFDRTAFGVLTPNIRDAFGLNNTGILLIVGLAAVVGLSMQVPIAMFADRTNRVRMMLIGACAFALFSAGTGLALTVWMLWIMRAGSGLGLATVGPTHNSLISDYYDIPYRPRVYSFHRAANSVGAIIGPLAAGLLAQAFGWRVPFLVLAVPTVVLIVVALKMREPTRGTWERKAMGVDAEIVDVEEPPPSFAEAWRMVWKIETLRRIFYALPFLAPAIVGFASLANLLYEQQFGLDEAQRGLIQSLAEPAQLVGVVVGAHLGTKYMQRGPQFMLRFVGLVAFVCAVLAGVFALSPAVWINVLANMGISGALAIVGPGVFAALSLAIPARARSVGFSMSALFVIPGVIVVLPLVGWMADNIGIRAGMLLMTPVFFVGGLVIGSARKVIANDIKNVWTSTAARSELLYERRQGHIKQLLVRGLDVSYGDVQVLFGVDFEVDQGEIVALLGTNGAGKSTLLKAICGVVQASNGAVVFDGRDVTHAPPHEIAALGVAMVPGGQGVFPSLTVAENLKVATWLERRQGGDVNARMDEVLRMFPVLSQRLDDPAANLSGGQQQMLALGMAFLSKPKLLAIDELSLGLAPVVVEQLLPVVRAIRDQGTTIVLVEQSVNVALTVAETAVFMEKGEIRFKGPTAELLERPDVLRSVFLEGASKGMAVAGSAPGSGEAVVVGPVADADATSIEAEPADLADLAEAGDVVGDVPVTGGLEVRDLSVRFGGIRAVNGVSFSVAPGEIVGIIGPNGAGKTTMFDLVSGFTSSDHGKVLIGGEDVTGLSPDGRARRGLGRSFQDARLFPALTVEETIAVALERWLEVRDPLNAAMRLPAFQDSEDDVRDRVDELIDLLGIESFRTKFVHELSTGSRRVVDLACVLAHHPTVVLLDEPSSGIAQKEAEALAPLILRIRDNLGASVVVIEHDMPLITSVSARLVALDQGTVVTIGPPDDVLAHPEVVASYLGNTQAVIARSGTRAGV